MSPSDDRVTHNHGLLWLSQAALRPRERSSRWVTTHLIWHRVSHNSWEWIMNAVGASLLWKTARLEYLQLSRINFWQLQSTWDWDLDRATWPGPPVSNIKTNYSFKINFIATDFSILVNLCFCSLQVFGKRQLEQFTLFPWVVINETLVYSFGDIKNRQLWVIT